MVSKFKKKNCLTLKLAAILALSIFLPCSTAFADGEFSYFDFKEVPSSRLLNPIYLDTSRTEKPVHTTNTSIPFNLRGQFDEADYFSSSTHDTPQAQAPPVVDFANLPPPSEYKKVNSLVKVSESERKNYVVETKTSDFFNPLEDAQEAVFATQKPPEDPVKEVQNVKPFEIIEDPVYSASADLQNVDVEGKEIAQVNIQGLKTISEDFVAKHINSSEGVLFSTEILQQDLQNLYNTGYFSDNMSVEPVLNPDDTVDLTFVLEENIIINKVSLIGNDVIKASELNPFVMGMQGKPQNLKEINHAIENIQNYYHEKGYILANVSSVDDNAQGDLTFTIWEGVINKINISGNERTKDYVISRNIMTQAGSVYNEEVLKKDLAKVFSTQIFDEVNRDIQPSEENVGTYDVTVVVKEKTTNSIGFGGGIDTGLGAFGSISLREDNFLGNAQKVSLSGIIGSGILLNDASIKNHMNYQVELSFFEPYFLNADNSLMSKLYFREMGSWNIPLAIERRIGFKTGIEHKVKGYDHLTTSFTAGVEHIGLKEGDFNKISRLYEKHHLNIRDRANQLSDGFFVHLTPGIRYSNLDDVEVPREGIIAQAQFNEAIGITDFDHTNGRLSGAVTRFFPVFKKSSFSLTGRAGIKIHGDDMPEIMAYRLGGPYSIRGFRMNGVGTGESFLMGSAELATPLPWVDRLKWDIFKKMRLTFFVDAGKVFDPTITNVLYDRPLHAITAGIGLRMYIPGIGPMSIDYGLPLINPGNYGSEHGYFTFGTGGLNGYGYGY